ncbi:LVIVD repeat-containing protein [Amycolatopsis sp. H20-H5]|uniref:LVIVD repeat-containing protein n=1 Tax=Amycolatopsis sp. H20-H5 TaxID=3046309 RepID=UPI002DBBCDDA|nr:hypothetical protein [Amycolatopsis sp. H20-H5]MEC3982349.1 hypothetical protein [Amycolatopsis sp. H20-H5]
MLRSCLVATTVAITLIATGLPAAACGEDDKPAAPAARTKGAPGAVKNVEAVGNVPGAAGAISIAFLQYGRRDVMVVSGEFGMKSYDLANPAAPKLIGELSLPGLWETEDTEVDAGRKLVFLSRDPRAFAGNTHTGESGIYVVDVSRPDKPTILNYVKVPAGHTTSCVDNCRYLWTGGPAKADNQPADWGGRPIWVTDVRDPRHPKVFPNPIELARNDGKTDYVHDVQVDDNGVAWVSGRGGVRGYWTNGIHRDPVQGKIRRATALDPVPYAGGGVDETAAPSKFMHNSFHPTGRRAADGADLANWRAGDLVYATEESFLDGCAGDGVLTISSLQGSYNGEGWRSTPEKPFRMKSVGTWSVAGQEGSDPASDDCSAHYFDVQGKVLVQSFYSQGTRFLDVSDPTNPTQIAYFRPADASAWAPYWHRGYVYVADNARGIDVLKLTA